MARRILVLGATGVIFCGKALERGYSLTILARSPNKLPAEVREHPGVILVDAGFNDSQKVQEALSTGATALVSFAGPVGGSKGTPITDFYRELFPQLVQRGFDRALVLSTPSFNAPEDKSSVKWKLAIKSVQIFFTDSYNEMVSIGENVSSQPTQPLKWTIFRVGFLGDEKEYPVHASFLGSGEDAFKLSRGSMAKWVLDELEDCEWVGKAPLLSN